MREQNNSPFVGKPVKMQQMRRASAAAPTASASPSTARWCIPSMRLKPPTTSPPSRRCWAGARRSCARPTTSRLCAARTRPGADARGDPHGRGSMTRRPRSTPAPQKSQHVAVRRQQQVRQILVVLGIQTSLVVDASQSRVNLSGMFLRAAAGSRRSDRPVADIGQRVD